ncbi:MAG: hypothetical protein E7I42_23605 [Pluralibacter gergoviae]|nr:hypothetical protein [Pluralibacter gergoviae]
MALMAASYTLDTKNDFFIQDNKRINFSRLDVIHLLGGKFFLYQDNKIKKKFDHFELHPELAQDLINYLHLRVSFVSSFSHVIREIK